MMNVHKVMMISLMICFGSAHFTNSQEPSASQTVYLNKATVCVAAASLIAVGVVSYIWLKSIGLVAREKVGDLVDDEIADLIILAFTPNHSIKKLAPHDRDTKFKKKAKLIYMRKQLLQHCNDFLNSAEFKKLSPMHQAAFRKRIKEVKKICDFIDRIRHRTLFGKPIFVQNPFENDPHVVQETMIDSFIEKKIIASMIFSAKPDQECTQQELLEKAKMAQKRKAILEKIKNKLTPPVFSLVINSELLIHFFGFE